MQIKDFKHYIARLAEELLAEEPDQAVFAYLNDEKQCLLPAQMNNTFVQFGHDGWQFSPDAMLKEWKVTLSAFHHVSDTADFPQINRAFAECEEIIDTILRRIRKDGLETQGCHWLRRVGLAGAVAVPVENVDDALYGYVISFTIALPWCPYGPPASS